MSEDQRTARPPATGFGERDRRALRAVAAQFFVNGFAFASFVPRLPEVRDRVGITVAVVGLAMSAAAAAGLLSSAAVGPLIARFGSRRVILVASTGVAVSLPVVGFADTLPVLVAGLVGVLALDVLVDVGMNLQGSWLSARRHTPVMNRLHGLWSLGTLAGALLASRLAAAEVSLAAHLVAAGLLLLAIIAWLSRGLLREDEHDAAVEEPTVEGVGAGATAATTRVTLLLVGAAGLFGVTAESVAGDWSAFRLADDLGASAGTAALGFVAVALGMTTARFSGDWVSERVSPRAMSLGAVALAMTGLAVATLVPTVLAGLVGFTVAGMGVATLLPRLYDAAAQLPGRPGAGLGALTAGIRLATLVAPLGVGALAATELSVGSAVALITLPSLTAFAVSTALLRRRSR